jgi:hypothetical protein
LNSPTFTDSTDEPTPLGLFTSSKGFKFNMPMDEDQILSTQENIGFDDNSGGFTNAKVMKNNVKDMQ